MPNPPEIRASLPAAWLYALAFNPRGSLAPAYRESMDKAGWLDEFPAVLTLQAGTYPRVEGQHRLAWLAKTGRLGVMVPVIIRYGGV